MNLGVSSSMRPVLWTGAFVLTAVATVASLALQAPGQLLGPDKPRFWSKSGFPEQAEIFRRFPERHRPEWSDRQNCVAFLRDFNDLAEDAAGPANRTPSPEMIRTWQLCAARFFPARSPEECAASLQGYREAVARSGRLARSRLPDYLSSFCGVELPAPS